VTELEQETAESPTTEAASGADRGVAGFMTGLLVGALVGAGVALLFAPARGDRIRRRLGRGARAFQERAREELEHAARRARREIARRR
jgi:gas vesicle protein